jgi:hypothetical protein
LRISPRSGSCHTNGTSERPGYGTRQLAWLRARLPATQSVPLDPVTPFGQPLNLNGKVKDVQLAGKHKPALNSVTDKARISKHAEEFWQLVEAFRQDPALEPS